MPPSRMAGPWAEPVTLSALLLQELPSGLRLSFDPARRLRVSHQRRADPSDPWGREMLPWGWRDRSLWSNGVQRGLAVARLKCPSLQSQHGPCKETVKWVLLIHAGSSAQALGKEAGAEPSSGLSSLEGCESLNTHPPPVITPYAEPPAPREQLLTGPHPASRGKTLWPQHRHSRSLGQMAEPWADRGDGCPRTVGAAPWHPGHGAGLDSAPAAAQAVHEVAARAAGP